MDIAALSMSMSQVDLQNEVGVSVMKMAMNNSVETNVNMAEMLDNMSVDENLGNNIDVCV